MCSRAPMHTPYLFRRVNLGVPLLRQQHAPRAGCATGNTAEAKVAREGWHGTC